MSQLPGADAALATTFAGHTHDHFDYDVQGTRVLCNPRGYAKDGVPENPLFDPGLIVDIAQAH